MDEYQGINIFLKLTKFHFKIKININNFYRIISIYNILSKETVLRV